MAITGFDLNAFKSNFQGGARAYLFMYAPNTPTTVDSYKYLVRSTSLPETTLEEIMVNWQGLDYKMSGKQTFTDWTITFNVDKTYNLRKDFEDWIGLAHQIADVHKYGSPSEYMRDQTLILLDYDGSEISQFTLVDAWPKSVGPVTLDYSSQDLAQFDVTFTYQYHKFVKGE